MKANFLTAAALSSIISCAAGYTIARANQLSEDTFLNAPPITFTGPAVPGGPDVTITGTVEQIYSKLHELNPKYDAWDFPEYQKRMMARNGSKNSSLEARGVSLEKRGRTKCDVSGHPVGNYITQCAEGLSCGIFLCNDNNFPIKVWCGNIVGDFHDIVNECGEDVVDWVSSVKGAIFRDGPPAWNTVVKNQSC
ncbi:hypothetical protein Dda_8324 [Drechslerella dactyloides]|uniref:Uncharacterized protein n=1 Tax=Drechslerella dactyloides TaxID=74499 RepID=A0AAD6NFR3_DREDA|nr:hypothetical protein Dda_8324 [Drechslerella dactyloides]